MLVLARKIQESVVVGGASQVEQLVKVTVIDIRGGTVRLGFEANTSVPVHRAEVWERICAETQCARCDAGCPTAKAASAVL